MNNILLMTDFSELSGYAKTLADKVAFHCGAKLHVLKVVDIPSEVEIGKEGNLLGGMSDDISGFEKEKHSSEEQMKSWTSDIKAEFITSIQYGRLQNASHDYIEEQGIDLVVMGTHGVSGMKELLSGSVTEHLIIKNSVPVLSLKCNRDNIDFANILITGDFESDEPMDLHILKSLQHVFDSTMHLLWVNTKSHFITTTKALEKMKAFAVVNELQNTEFHIYNDESIEQGIVNFSNNFDASHQLDIDILAVEKKHKSQLGYFLTGCQATSFVNHIFKPILTYTKN